MSCDTATYPALPGHAVPSPEIRPASRWPMIRLRIAPRNETGTNGFMLWIDIFHAMRFAVALKSAPGTGTLLKSPIIAMPMVPVLKFVAWAPMTPRSTPP